MDALSKGTASQLSSPGSTAGNASVSPALLPAAAIADTAATAVTSVGFPWSGATATTPALGFPALEGLTAFDPNPWISNPSLGAEAGLGMYHEYVATTSAAATPGIQTSTAMPNYHHHHLQPQLQHDPLAVPDFATAMNDWSGLDDHGSKGFLAMMGNAGSMDLSFETAMLHTAAQNAGLDPNFGLDFSSMLHPSSNSPQLGTAVSHKQHVESPHGSGAD